MTPPRTAARCALASGLLTASFLASNAVAQVSQEAYVKATNTGGGDRFGQALAIDGDRMVVGASGEDGAATLVDGDGTNDDVESAGAAYVYVRSAGGWAPEAYLKSTLTAPDALFGAAVAISGDTVVVGAPEQWYLGTKSGAAVVFERSGGTWSQSAILLAPHRDTSDAFGTSVAIDGDTIVVGAHMEQSAATGIDGDATDDSANAAGAAYVFTRDGGGWSFDTYLKASNAEAGQWFGYRVAVDGDTIAVSAPLEDSGVPGDPSDHSAPSSGAVYVFERSGSTWAQQAYLKSDVPDVNDELGSSLDLHRDTIVAGTIGEDSAATGVDGDATDDSADTSGAAWVFRRTGTTWSQEAYLKASNTDAGDWFGDDVAVFGDTVVVGAPLEDSAATSIDGDASDDSAISAGAAYVFSRYGTTWVQTTYLKASNAQVSDNFGHAVDVDGDTLAVGAPSESSGSTGVGGDPNDNSLGSAGAVYTFVQEYWETYPGCFGNTATWVEPTAPAVIGRTVAVELLGGTTVDGFGAVFYGALGITTSGCGTLIAPGREVLLSGLVIPTLYAVVPMSASVADVPLSVPANPGIVGFHVTLQAYVVDVPAFTDELSTALEFVVQP